MMRLCHAAVLLSFGLAGVALAQEVPGPSPDDPTATVQTGVDAADRITIPIHVDGKGRFPFVVDTGSQRTVISRELADRLALAADRPVKIVSMTGLSEAATVQVPRLSFGATRMRDVQAPVLAGAHLGAAGLLGLDGLQRKRLVLNFRTGQMNIMQSRASDGRDPRDPADAIVVEARSRLGQLILLDSRADGRRVNIIVDTGAEYSIGNAALLRQITKAGRSGFAGSATLTSVTGGELSGPIAIVRRVTMGNLTMNNLPVLFAEASPFAELGLSDKPALLLGVGALRGFDRVAIDFGRKRVDFLLPDQGALGGVRLAGLIP